MAAHAGPGAAAHPCAGRTLLIPVEEGDWGQRDTGEAHLGETVWPWDSECVFVSECVCTGLHSGVISRCWKFCRTRRDQVFEATAMAAGLGQELAHLAQPAHLAHPAPQQSDRPGWSQG